MITVSMTYGLWAKIEGACSKYAVFKVTGEGVVVVQELL